MNVEQVEQQVAVAIEEYMTSENAGMRSCITPRFASFASFLNFGQSSSYSIVALISTDIFLMMEAKLALLQNMKIVTL